MRRAEGDRVRRHGAVRALAGGLLLIVAIAGLAKDVSWLAEPFYAWAWWGYILLLDGYSAWKRQNSILTTRRQFFLPLCLWSVTFWFFFELINARIQNWYYVGVFPLERWLAGSVFAVAAFATVFLGIFQTMDALSAAGLWRDWRGRKRQFPLPLTYGLQLVGILSGGLALLSPHYLAPLVWGSFTLIVDPWNYRRGAGSLLRDIEEGNHGRLARLLLAGLICGVVWESLNFFAPQKWIYTVRGLEGFKVFEMPLIGFLGFPALALDCMAAYAMFSSWMLGNRTWENPADLSYQPILHAPRSREFFWITAIVQVAFWATVASFITFINVASIHVELSDLRMTASEIRQLNQRGITRPRQFLKVTDGAAQRSGTSPETFGLSQGRLQELRQRALLYTFKGIGYDHGRRLEQIGVRSPDDLKGWEPGALMARLASLDAPSPLAPPRLDFVRVWILAARDHEVIQNGR